MSTFQIFDKENDVVENQRTTISSGLWSGGSGTLTAAFTQSTNGNITGSFLDIYNEDPNLSSSAEVQYAIGYAHYDGSGSTGNTTKLTTGGRQSAALYSQFRNVLLAPNTDKFEFTSSPTASGDKDFYFVSFQRARQREKIDPGNWELHLSGLMPAGDTFDSVVKLIDDSGAATNVTVNQGGRVFNVVSGSVADGVNVTAAAETTFGAYGLFYPDLGIVLLNAKMAELSGGLGVNARSADAFTNRPQVFYNSIKSGSYFAARREEEISSTNFFVRVNNKKFNFSSNPTFATGSDGSLTQPTFFKDPKTFITQVGLYNDENELLAIAKLSQPLLNSYSREAIIKVKLDF
jgi:hypothetical protein|tara:strand:- start:1000 stop:2043 length:1044 start_codon:yes stop_codon:yes gene_type:complete